MCYGVDVADTFASARLKLKSAEEISETDLNSGKESADKSRRRRRNKPGRLCESSGEEDNTLSLLKKTQIKLPPLPPKSKMTLATFHPSCEY